MQAAGHFVGVLVELSAGMELRHDHFGGGHAFAFVDLGGDTAPIVFHGHRAVGVQRDAHRVAIPRQRLIDSVVHHLVDHVVQARTVVGVADIHAGPFAHGIEAFQDLDGLRTVVGSSFSFAFGSRCHVFLEVVAGGCGRRLLLVFSGGFSTPSDSSSDTTLIHR